jgi:hypothetical protein
MTKKQVTTPKTVTGAVSARVASPKAPRVTSSKHKKATAGEPIAAGTHASPLEAISKLAYGYWEARGCQGGDPLTDWVRAEAAYSQSLS